VYFWSPVPLGLVRSARFARSLWSAPAQLMVAYVLRFFWANIVLRFCALGGRFVEPSYQTLSLTRSAPIAVFLSYTISV
jgi:hypothetical protein